MSKVGYGTVLSTEHAGVQGQECAHLLYSQAFITLGCISYEVNDIELTCTYHIPTYGRPEVNLYLPGMSWGNQNA